MMTGCTCGISITAENSVKEESLPKENLIGVLARCIDWFDIILGEHSTQPRIKIVAILTR